MFLISIRHKKHSAWLTRHQAEQQLELLVQHGYAWIDVKYAPKLSLPNGFIFN